MQAHEVEPETSQPAPGVALGESPPEVVLVFAEELTEQGSGLQVLDSSGSQVNITGGGVDLNDPQHATLRAGLPALPDGVYQVAWTVVLTDGDASSGSYHFGVGKVVVPTEPAEEAEAAPGEPAASQSQNSLPTLLWVVLLALVIGGVAVFVASRKKK